MKEIYKREKYLSRIRPFYDSDVIKVITGIRRSGKSCILRLIIEELENNHANNAAKPNIIFVPLDELGFKYIKKPEQLEKKILKMYEESIANANSEDLTYLFIDEVQNVKGFEEVVQAFQEEGFSIFITGSNSYLLSDEISTKLTGRYINFEIFPLDFNEYIYQKEQRTSQHNFDIYEEFKKYSVYGGFPQSLEFDSDASKQDYTRAVIKSIFDKDIRSRNRILNFPVYERVRDFLINNYASPFSLKSLMQTLGNEGFTAKSSTVRSYIDYLCKAKIIYECNRFDLKSKRALKRQQKYYLADISIYFSMNVDNRPNFGPTLENLVYLYLISNGYRVSVGIIGNWECDFIARSRDNKYSYIQVAYTLEGANENATRKIIDREFKLFRKVQDSYPCYIITLDRFGSDYEGIKHINAIDLFLGKTEL